MSYAKPCKYNCGTQIVWDKFASQFKDNQTGEPHTREVCESIRNKGKYSPQAQKEFVDMHVPKPQQQQKPDYITGDIMAILKIVETLDQKVDKVMSMVETFEQRNNIKFDFLAKLIKNSVVGDKDTEISRLRQQVTELEEVLKKREDNFVPANQVKQKEPEEESQQEHDQHVRDMVAKGRTEEELEL